MKLISIVTPSYTAIYNFVGHKAFAFNGVGV